MMKDQEIEIPQPGSNTARNLLKPFASLKVTVGLFALCMGLVFFGTLAQLDNGIWKVVEDYFWSWFVKVRIDLLAKFGKVFFPAFFNSSSTYQGSFYFPAGKLIGLLLLINLLAAHLVRFKLSWSRSGILMIHGGMILMLVGEAITRTMQVEQRMSISEGQGTNYAEDNRNYELAFVDVTNPNANTCTVVPFPLLKQGETISHPDLPVNLSVVSSMVNAKLDDVSKESPAIGTAGNALIVNAIPTSEVSGLDTESQPDMPAVYVKFINKKDGQPGGTYLFSLLITLLDRKEPIEIDGHKYEVSLRFKRLYKPFTVYLKEFRFDRFQGTSLAMNFSSDVIVVDPERHAERAAHISMNDPLRYRGEAFYQAGYDQKTEKGTILQVVQNPGWLIPYISCIIVTLGMIVHFSNTLPKHAKKISIPWVNDSKRDNIWIWASWVIVAVVLIGAFAPLFVQPKTFDFTSAGRIPVLDRGRVKPLETLARVSLRMISGQETIDYQDADGNKIRVSPVKWYFDVSTLPSIKGKSPALKYPIFKVDNEQLQNELGLKNRSGQRYSIEELAPKLQTITRRAMEASKKKATERDLTEQKFFDLNERIRIFSEIFNRTSALCLPPRTEGGEWQSFENVSKEIFEKARLAAFEKLKLTPEELQNPDAWSEARKKEVDDTLSDCMAREMDNYPDFKAWKDFIQAYQDDKPDQFNQIVTNYRATQFNHLTNFVKNKIVAETIFERIAPFYWCIGLYVIAFIISLIGICGGPTGLQKASFRILLAAFILHTAALVVRIILQGRPPVTNLYSSAIFIGWAAVGFGLFFEWYFRGGFANIVGAVLGGLTTIVAHGVLGTGSDTMEMLQAVLDTNFWLATHVICITLGYVATYFAGILGVIYALRRVTAGWGATKDWVVQERTLTTMTYIVLCIAMTLSFLGTVLGGIWADQSWGRFWGWDPKENGAVLIVIWNALILHARWGGMIKGRGIAVLAIIGAMVTIWSWFGTNQLGIGLHAYGFSTELAVGCAVSWVGLGIVALLGMMPKDFLPALNRTND